LGGGGEGEYFIFVFFFFLSLFSFFWVGVEGYTKSGKVSKQKEDPILNKNPKQRKRKKKKKKILPQKRYPLD